MGTVKVLIVDDERMALQNLVDIFDWKGSGFEVVATAFNGKQAFSLFQKYVPQIVITDIRMPFMDGLELVARIRKISSEVKILLLTAYGDFEYAKFAIDHGVDDYILKNEITETLLKEKLLKLKTRILSENVTNSLALQRAVSNYIANPESELPEEFIQSPKFSEFCQKAHCFLLLKEDVPIPFSLHSKRQYMPGYENKINSICYAAARCSREVMVQCVAALQDNEIVVVLNLKNQISSAAIYQSIKDFSHSLQKMIFEKLNSKFSIFNLYRFMTIREFHAQFPTFQSRMHLKYFFGTGKIYDLDSRDLTAHQSDFTMTAEDLETFMERENCENAIAFVESVFEKVNYDYNALITVSQQFYYVLEKLFSSLGMEATDRYREDLYCILPALLDVEHIRQWIENSIKEYFEEKKRLFNQKYTKEIVHTIDYIRRNFKDPKLKADQISKQVGLSPNRLNIVFKKETGKTIKEYVTELRMEEAKKLLDSGSYKVYEVAKLVGYGSSQYFSHLFYSITGTYPVDMKRDAKA